MSAPAQPTRPRAIPPRAQSHRERLLRQGMKSFYANGFHGTTVDAILVAADVPKGSFYHHFGSKDAFGRAVLERYMHLQLDMLSEWSGRESLSTAEQLTGYFNQLSEIFVRSGFQRACLAGKFSTELAAGSDPFREQLAEALTTWHTALTEMLRRGQQAGEVRTDRPAAELSHSVLAIVQGAFVIALSARDPEGLAAVGATIALIVEPST